MSEWMRPLHTQQHGLVRWRRRGGVRCLQVLTLGAATAAFSVMGNQTGFLSGAPQSDLIPTTSRAPPFLAPLSGLVGASIVDVEQACAMQGSFDDVASFPFPLTIGVAVVGIAAIAALSFGDEAKTSVDDKKEVTEYFNGEGFDRWQRIYGETDDVNPVQKDIRVGHAETIVKILQWLDHDRLPGSTVCDAGCGTGNLSIPLASRGAKVTGSDISSAMVTEAEKRAKATLDEANLPTFKTSDLEALDGEFNTVCCVDVLIHYPPERLAAMVGRLASLSKDRLILSFAPKTWYYTLLKRIGELFPGKSKTTRAYLHEEELVEDALRQAGFQVTRREMTATSFYFSRLLEAKPATAA